MKMRRNGEERLSVLLSRVLAADASATPDAPGSIADVRTNPDLKQLLG